MADRKTAEPVEAKIYGSGWNPYDAMGELKDPPTPLELDWSSPAGEAHHEAMMRLDPEDPVRVAHLSIYTGKD